MGVKEHRHHAPKHVGFAVITVSDSRTPASDDTGSILREGMTSAGHRETLYLVVKDEVEEIREALSKASKTAADVIIFNGGTGISKRDLTVEALQPQLDRVLPGFGEIFRSLSYREIGPAAILSRAMAGIHGGRLVLALPGSPAAAKLAMEKLILPELGHMVWELKR